MAIVAEPDIQGEIDKAYQSLRGIDDKYKTLTGRNPIEATRGRGRGRGGIGSRLFNSARGDISRNDSFGGRGGAFNSRRRSFPERDSEVFTTNERFGGLKRPRLIVPADEDEDDQSYSTKFASHQETVPSVQSAVTLANRDDKTRDTAITEMKTHENKGVAARNKRMFGMLLGTLTKFRKDEKTDKYKDQEKKQKEMEAKLEESKREEHMKVVQEREDLLKQRRQQENEIKKLTRKRALVQICERECLHLEALGRFIQTKSKPPIFYSPAKHSIRTTELQMKTERKMQELISRKKESLEKDLEKEPGFPNNLDDSQTGIEKGAKEGADGPKVGPRGHGRGDKKQDDSSDEEEAKEEENDDNIADQEETGVHESTAMEQGGTAAEGTVEQGGPAEGTLEQGGTVEGTLEQVGTVEGTLEQGGTAEGTLEQVGTVEGTLEQGGTVEGTVVEGTVEGTVVEGTVEGTVEQGSCVVESSVEDKGTVEDDVMDDIEQPPLHNKAVIDEKAELVPDNDDEFVE